MRWGVRAVLIAIAAVCLYASLWCYQNWYILVCFKRFAHFFLSVNSSNVEEDIKQMIATQPATTHLPIVISVPAKQGTTWTGHVSYQVRARGGPIPAHNLMFDLPYLEPLPMLPGSINEWRNASGHMIAPIWELNGGREPHLLRTHMMLQELRQLDLFPRYRVMTVFRDPLDALASAWRFMPEIVHVPHRLIDPNVFARLMFLSGSFDETLQNMVEFWQVRDDPNVLILFFDELSDDLSGSLARVAQFMDLSPPLTESELKTIEQQCTHSAMKGLSRFAGDIGRDLVAESLGLSNDQLLCQANLLVRANGGKIGDGSQVFSTQVQEQIYDRWNAIVTQRTGMQNYSHFMSSLRRQRNI